MRNVNPIELNLDEQTPPLLATQIVENHLVRPIDEISAIASLLGMARKLPSSRERFGYDVDFLDEVMLRRIRELATDCQAAVNAIVSGDCDPQSVAELKKRPTFED